MPAQQWLTWVQFLLLNNKYILREILSSLPDCVVGLHRPPGLHLLLRPGAVALLQAAAPAAVLPAARRWRRQRPAGGVSGDHPQQGPGAAQVQEGAALQRQKRHLVRGYLPDHPLRQVSALSRRYSKIYK